MSNTLEKWLFMVYPCWCYSRGILAAVLVFGMALSFQVPVYAQSDEAVSLDSRNLGLTYQNNGNFGKALFYYERALALAPDDPAILNDIGLMHEYLGHNTDAEKSYLKAISLDANFMAAYGNLGFFYSKQRQYALAVKYLNTRVAKGKAGDPWILAAQEELNAIYDKVPALNAQRINHEAAEFSQGLATARERMKQRAAREQSVGFEAAYAQGMKALEAGRFDEAIPSLEAAVGLMPNSGAARHGLKRARYGKQKSDLEAEARLFKEESKSHLVVQALNNAAVQ